MLFLPVETLDGLPLWDHGDPIHFRSEVNSAAAEELQELLTTGMSDGSEAASISQPKKLRLDSTVVFLSGQGPRTSTMVKPSWWTGMLSLTSSRGGHSRGRGQRGWNGWRGRQRGEHFRRGNSF